MLGAKKNACGFFFTFLLFTFRCFVFKDPLLGVALPQRSLIGSGGAG